MQTRRNRRRRRHSFHPALCSLVRALRQIILVIRQRPQPGLRDLDLKHSLLLPHLLLMLLLAQNHHLLVLVWRGVSHLLGVVLPEEQVVLEQVVPGTRASRMLELGRKAVQSLRLHHL